MTSGVHDGQMPAVERQPRQEVTAGRATGEGVSPAVVPDRAEQMRADWASGMRQVDIAAKYGISQALVSRTVGGSPAKLVNEVRRLRAGIRDYFLSSDSTQAERDRALWRVIQGDDA